MVLGSMHKQKDMKPTRPPPLRLSSSSSIRKPPVAPVAGQVRRPVIIHTYSPKIIQTDSDNFMWLVQKLTGSSDTRLRCKQSKPGSSRKSGKPKAAAPCFSETEVENVEMSTEIEEDESSYEPIKDGQQVLLEPPGLSSPKSPLMEYAEAVSSSGQLNSSAADPFQQFSSSHTLYGNAPATPGWSPLPTPNFMLQQEFLRDLPILSPSIFSPASQQLASWALRH